MKINTAFFARIFLLGIVIPLLMSTVVYQGFSSNYTLYVFSEQGFKRQYDSGVYKYRVLGKVLLLKTYERIQYHDLPTIAPTSLKLMDQRGDRHFYSAYFYLNTIFLCLTCMVLFFVLGGHKTNTDFLTSDLPVLFLCALMALSQYVVVPYDMLTYFFLSTAVWLILQNSRKIWSVLALCVVVVLATLTRETAALIMSFYFAWHYKSILTKPAGFKPNREQGILLLLTGCFIATYIGLRLILGSGEQAVFQSLTFPTMYDVSTLSGVLASAGIVFLASVTLLFFLSGPTKPELWVFILAASPYVIAMLLVATPWEIRLWVPILLLLTVMKVNTARGEISPAN